MKRQQCLWLLVIPVLLLAAGLAVHRLYGYPLNWDERATFRLTGSKFHDPRSLAEVWAAVKNVFPDQAYGLPLIYWGWGRVFGWSDFAIRTLPWFSGLLALAWVYRAGRDLFAPLVGLAAVMLLGTSVYFVTFMHVARSFSLVALFTVMTIWSYWRLVLHPTASGRDYAAQLVFLVGCIGIFYTHYYSVLLLVGLNLWHLLFIPKNRLWWRPVLLFGLAGMAFLLELEGFLQGVSWTQTMPWHTGEDWMQRTTEVLPGLFFVLTNGILRLPGLSLPAVSNIMVLILMFLIVLGVWWCIRKREWFHQIQFLLFCALATLLLMLFINEILLVLRFSRLRYMMALWPMSALLIGWGIWRARGHWRLIASSCMGAFFVFGIWVNVVAELQYEIYYILERYTVHPLSKQIEAQSNQLDLLLIDSEVYQAARSAGYYFALFPQKHLVLEDTPDSRQEFSQAVGEHLRIMTLAGGGEHRDMIAELPSGMVFCERYLDRKNLVLELYTQSTVHCPSDAPSAMRFGDEIELAASEVRLVSADTLQVDLLMHSEENTAMTAYSVAIHVFDVESGEKVAQGDQGLWLGRYNPVRSEIDIGGLEASEYEVRVGVYNWQTLERLEGVDLESGVTANLLPLSRFQIE